MTYRPAGFAASKNKIQAFSNFPSFICKFTQLLKKSFTLPKWSLQSCLIMAIFVEVYRRGVTMIIGSIPRVRTLDFLHSYISPVALSVGHSVRQVKSFLADITTRKMKNFAISLFSTLLAFSNASFWEAGPCPPKPEVVTPFEPERVRNNCKNQYKFCSEMNTFIFLIVCWVLAHRVWDTHALHNQRQHLHSLPVRDPPTGYEQHERVRHKHLSRWCAGWGSLCVDAASNPHEPHWGHCPIHGRSWSPKLDYWHRLWDLCCKLFLWGGPIRTHQECCHCYEGSLSTPRSCEYNCDVKAT